MYSFYLFLSGLFHLPSFLPFLFLHFSFPLHSDLLFLSSSFLFLLLPSFLPLFLFLSFCVVLFLSVSFSKCNHYFIHWSSVSSLSWSRWQWIHCVYHRITQQFLFTPPPSFLHFSALMFIKDGGRWSEPLPALQTAALALINVRWPGCLLHGYTCRMQERL